MRPYLSWLLVGSLLGLTHALARAETTELVADADTALLEVQPDYNLGAQTDLPAGTLGGLAGNTRARVLLHFDLARSLPSGARIQSATLHLTVVRIPDGAANSTFALVRMQVPWQEGSRAGASPGGSLAQAGDSTWDARVHPSEPWAAPGGQPGIDFAPTPSSTQRIAGLGRYEFEFGSQALGELQQWLDFPASNHGWMLRSLAEEQPKTARRFASREQPNGQPILVVRWLPPPTPPRISGLQVTPSEWVLRFMAEPDVTYEWEMQALLGGDPWQTLQTAAAGAAAGERSLTNPAAPLAAGFFRLKATR